ncbi:MAG: response regulator [Acinetobacter sp.]|jgi:twitching motility two-component system response regulator PilH
MPRILVVEDSPTGMFYFKTILIRHGFEVLEAVNGVEAITMAQAELPDLILMDVVMPKVNGFQATRQITRNETTKHIPIVIISTKDQEIDRVWGIRQGACDYLTKPVGEQQLIDVVNSYLKTR